MELGAPVPPAAWSTVGPTPRGQHLELVFAVKHRGPAQLHDTGMRVSRPSSPEYGLDLTSQEVHDLIASAPEHLEAVVAFIRQHGAVPRKQRPTVI